MKTVLFWVLVGASAIALSRAEVIENNPCDQGRDANSKKRSIYLLTYFPSTDKFKHFNVFSFE